MTKIARGLKLQKITIIIVLALINHFTRVCSGSLRKRKNKQFCVQKFTSDRVTWQRGKLDVVKIVISNAKFLNKVFGEDSR